MKYFRAVNHDDPEDVLYLSSNIDLNAERFLEEKTRIGSYGYKLQECPKEEFDIMTQDINDYIINAGPDRYNLAPIESAHTDGEAIERAEELCKGFKSVEVVYMPCDNIDINEVIWSWHEE